MKDKIVAAWVEASNELGIKINAPFILIEDAAAIEFMVHIEDFGSKNGTILFSLDEMDGINFAKKYGYYFSVLSESYNN